MKPQELNLIELFSGIGGFSKGLEDAGFKIKKHYFSEIDKHAIANYKYNFPNAKYIGSVTDISGRDFSGINAITFGSPCQDFSLAGKREGMDGQRSVLILEAIRLVSELRPDFFIWENVKGAFSSNTGADFWAILQAFTNIGGYRLEWQLLNTKWFLPQNRERIYLVGHLATSTRGFGRVFPIGEDVEIRTETRTNKKETNSAASALMAGHHNSQTGNFIQVKPDNLSVIQLSACTESGGVQPYQQNRVYADFGVMTSLDLDPRKNIATKNKIRRLTEIEWERLQGFPDDWTKFGVYQKQVWINKKEGTFKIVEGVQEIPKTERYKMCGNAVTTDAVTAIGKRLIHNIPS